MMNTNAVWRVSLVCVISIVVSLISIGQLSARIAPESVLGIWLLDENKGDTIKDSSIHGNDGVFVGEPEWVEGRFGSALKLDGATNYAKIPDSESLNNYTDKVTLVSWIKYAVEPNNFNGMILFKHNHLSLYSRLHTSELWFQLYNEKDVGGNAIFPFKDLGDWEDEWYHTAGTCDGSEINIYVNGVKGTPNTISGGIIKTAGQDVQIGARAVGDLVFNGTIDEAAIFNVCLTEDEIKEIMN